MVDEPNVTDRVLVDPALDEELARSGIVSLALADREELAAVEASYWELVPEGESGIVLDYLRRDRGLVRKLADLMAPVWERVVPQVFEHHYPVYTSFVVKHPGEGSSLYLHRDLHVDDERHRRTFALWMPLTDTGPELDNGPLAFVRGSEHIRYGGFGPNAAGVFSPYDTYLRSRLEPFSVPAGSGLVYDAKLLHASAPNRTDRARVAVGCLLARRDQPVTQVFATGRRHRQVFEVDREYFIDHGPEAIARDGIPAHYPLIDEYDEDPATTRSEVLGPVLDDPSVEREVIVPHDLEALAGRRQPLSVREGPRPAHGHDLAIAAADLAPPPPTIAGGVALEATPGVGAVELVGGRRRVGEVPEAVPDVVVPLGPLRTVAATLVVLDPSSRAVLTAPGGRRHELVVLECPAVRSGAVHHDHVAELDLGRCLDLPPGESVHVWNEGPGPLVVVVRASRR
ncbi:MAG: phytanoyl-CoA dioxygenase family protein [Acidimicrobiales bacterium]|nr:phytanoyl-CoA dioxygenase family protein [Acidimicrobiales bacterium]